MKEEIVKNLAEGTDNILDEEVTQYGKVLHMVVEKIEKGLQEKNEDSDLQ